MSFWLRESKSMFVLRTIPRWVRWCSLVCLVAVFGTIWYVFWYQPLQEACRKTMVTIGELSQRNALLYKIIQKKPLFAFQKTELAQKLQKLIEASHIGSYAMVDLLLESLKQHDVSCMELKPLDVKQGAFWQDHSFDLIFKGKFKNIKAFTHDFFTLKQFISCNKLSLTRWKNHRIKGELRVTFITFGEHEEVF